MDNTVLNSGSGGDTIATDDIGGIKHQRVKVEFGADGSATDVSLANPLPVSAASQDITTLRTTFSAAATNSALITIGAGSHIEVTKVTVAMDAASPTDILVRIGFGAAATPTTTGVVLSNPGLTSGQVQTEGGGGGIIGVGADGEDLRITTVLNAGTVANYDVVTTYRTVTP